MSIAHKVTDLKIALNLGMTFQHTKDGHAYRYKITYITPGVSDQHNDKIGLESLDDGNQFEVEPEWFNQRNIKIISQGRD